MEGAKKQEDPWLIQCLYWCCCYEEKDPETERARQILTILDSIEEKLATNQSTLQELNNAYDAIKRYNPVLGKMSELLIEDFSDRYRVDTNVLNTAITEGRLGRELNQVCQSLNIKTAQEELHTGGEIIIMS